MTGRSGLILPPGMGVVHGNPNAPPTSAPAQAPDPAAPISRAEAEELAVNIAEFYFRQTQKVVTDTLLQLGIIAPKHLEQSAETPALDEGGA